MMHTIGDPEATFQASLARVAKHFPQFPHARIDAMMRNQYAALAGRPIQMYVSNLVEHDTRARLSQVRSIP